MSLQWKGGLPPHWKYILLLIVVSFSVLSFYFFLDNVNRNYLQNTLKKYNQWSSKQHGSAIEKIREFLENQSEKNQLIKGTRAPKIIHQILLSKKKEKVPQLTDIHKKSISSFQEKNRDFLHVLWKEEDVSELVRLHYPDFYPKFQQLKHFIWKVDFARYMILNIYGGLYSDLDTICLRPIDKWANEYLTLRHLSVSNLYLDSLIGLEVRTNEKMIPEWRDYWPRDVQFVQWTILSSPHNPVMIRIVERVIQKLSALKQSHHPDNERVMETTGPGIWTDAVLDFISLYGGTKEQVFQTIDDALVVGNQGILPIYAYSPGPITELHSKMGTKDAGLPGTLVAHHFAGTWR